MSQGITIHTEGRRHYLLHTPYAMRDQLKAAGCKWDPERRAWWTGKRDVAERFVASASTEASTESAPSSEPSREAPGEGATVAGRATYKGKSYYVAGRVDRGRTHYDDRVSAVTSRDGSRVLLYFRDGSSQFWAPLARVSGSVIRVDSPMPMTEGARIVKTYDRPQTIGRLRLFAEEATEARRSGMTPQEARAERTGRCAGCGGPIRDAGHHAAMGGYCGSCAFDEFDC